MLGVTILIVLKRLFLMCNIFSSFSYQRQMWFRFLIRATCVLSVVSVCLNTPKTITSYPSIYGVTLGMDIFCFVVLFAEFVVKVRAKDVFNKKSDRKSTPYFKNFGNIFEFIMMLLILISVILQILEKDWEKTGWVGLKEKAGEHYIYISVFRSPRPLLLLRFIKTLLHLSLPKKISSRSLKQISSVLLFTVYFMSFFAAIGVQTFGLMKHYCIIESADPKNVSVSDFLLPTARCKPNGTSNDWYFTCPPKFKCEKVVFQDKKPRPYFENIGYGFLTMYEIMSMEGWSPIMYAGIDTRVFIISYAFFVCCIFFVAWLMKNIFIAIVSEAFADLRVQMSTLATKQAKKEGRSSEILKKSSSGVQLVKKRDTSNHNWLKRFVEKGVHHPIFKCIIYLCIIADAVFQCGVRPGKERENGEIAFTIVFIFEMLLKIYGLGWRHYFLDSILCQFEAILCIGSTAFLYPVVSGSKDQGYYAVFQVLRPFRLIVVWGGLYNFFKRILGSGKKLGSLVFFTAMLLVIASGVSLQLFCGIGLNNGISISGDYEEFHEFPQALQSIFQVLMSEAWNEVMDNVADEAHPGYAPIIFIFFVLFHFIAALVLISVFVALILDNLELDEEVKLVKQRKLGEEAADMHQKLPHRLRVFELMKAKPKVVKVNNLGSDIPKVRRSFISTYIDETAEEEIVPPIIKASAVTVEPRQKANEQISLNFVQNTPKEKNTFIERFRKQSSVTNLMQEVQMRRQSSYQRSTDSMPRNTSSFRSRLGTIGTKISGKRGTSYSESPNSTTRTPLPEPKTLTSRLLSQKSNTLGQRNEKTTNQLIKSQGQRSKEIDISQMRQKLEEAQRKKEAQIDYLRENYPRFDQSLFAMSVENPIRKFIHKIVHARYIAFGKDSEESMQMGAFSMDRFKRYLGTQTYLDWLMLIVVNMSCLIMVWETPRERTFDRLSTKTMEYIFVIASTIELLLKVLADGVVFSPNALVSDISSLFHVFIYIVSLVYIIWQPSTILYGSGAMMILIFRCFRPLLVIALAPPLRKVVNVLIRGYKDIVKVAILQFVIMFVFASYGVQAFHGQLKRCNDKTMTTKETCKGIYMVKLAGPRDLKTNPTANNTLLEIAAPRRWRNPRYFHFDSMGSALMALFEVLSLEGWTGVRDILTKRVGWVGSVYLHLYVFIACLIGLTLFIGVIVSNFNENKGIALYTVEQKRWEDLKKRLELAQPLHMPPRPTGEGFFGKGTLYDIINGRPNKANWYNRFIVLVIFINSLTLMCGQLEPTELSISTMNGLTAVAIICCFLFVLDAALKIYTLSFKGYWLSYVNRLDLVLAVLGVIYFLWTVIACYGSTRSTCEESHVFGVALFILRFLSMSGKNNGLRMLMRTMLRSLLQSAITLFVLVWILCVYAFLGMNLFGTVKRGIALNRHANFSTCYNALSVLFRIATGEDWNKLMRDVMLKPPYCKIKSNLDMRESNCGNTVAAIIYFYSYNMLITWIFLNLFIAVVIESFTIFYSTDSDSIMSQTEIRNFQDAWNIIDMEKKSEITVSQARLVLRLIQGRLALDNPESKDPLLFKKMCCEVEKLRNGKNIYFHDLLFVLAYRSVDISKSLQLEERLAREELDEVITEEVATETIKQWAIKVWRDRKKRKESAREGMERKVSCKSSLFFLFIIFWNQFLVI